jgi:hypothetical protein
MTEASVGNCRSVAMEAVGSSRGTCSDVVSIKYVVGGPPGMNRKTRD